MSGRLTQSGMVDKLLAVLSRTRGEHSSVTLTRSVSGKIGFEVVVRTDETDIVSIDQARIAAVEQFETLTTRFVEPFNGTQAATEDEVPFS